MSSKRRRHNRRNQRNRNKKRRKGEFQIGTFICIRKQHEGVGIINKTGNKNSYLIAFKNGKWGWYRKTKINVITEEEYNDASSDFIINKNLPSPSPTPLMSYSPSPSAINNNINNQENIQINQQIKFKNSMEQNDINDTDNKQQSQESTIQIKIEQINASEHTKTDDTVDAHEQSELKTEIESNMNALVTDIEIKQDDISDENKSDIIVATDINEENNTTTDIETMAVENIDNDVKQDKDKSDEVIVDDIKQENDENIALKSMEIVDDIKQENDKNVKNIKIQKKNKEDKHKKQKINKIAKPKISKFEKKMKLYYKVKDLRERSFLIMCDENKMIDFKSLYEYIEHFGNIKPSKNKVKEFLNFMKPNGNNMVSFSKFVKAIDDDGDVIVGFNRFKKCGNARSKK